MTYVSTTPFGQRPVTAGLIRSVRAAQATPALPQTNKWELFRQLCVARHAYGLTDRDLGVLNALLSFHPGAILGDNASLVVFPSNASLAQRAHGMAESTLRRHLAALVASGVILRQDSPNGKRYAQRDRGGDLVAAYGFDLRPLLVRAVEIGHNAAEAQAAADRIKRLRAEITLMRRDAVKFAIYGQEDGLPGDWEAELAALMVQHRALRRNLGLAELTAIRVELRETLDRIAAMLGRGTEKMGGKDGQNERHIQISTTDSDDLEPCQEKGQGAGEPRLPLALVVKACPDILPYAQDEIRDWRDLIAVAAFVRGMMGISPQAWEVACRDMGPAVAAITVCCILQRVDQINSPGGYLRSLTAKAGAGAFSPGPMVMALLGSGKS